MNQASNKQKIGSYLLSKIPISLLQKISRIRLITPFYHMVSDEEVLHIKYLYGYKNRKEFKDDLDFLLKYYSPISLQDLLDFFKKKRQLPQNCFLLTFDDGLREMYDIVAPILFQKGIPATFFVNSDFVDNKRLYYGNKISIIIDYLQKAECPDLEKSLKKILLKNRIDNGNIISRISSMDHRQELVIDDLAKIMNINFEDYLLRVKPYLTSDQIMKMIKGGFAIGAHSIDHPDYSLLSSEEQLKQTIESVRFVKNKFSLSYGAFAFPHTDKCMKKEFFTKLYDSKLIDVSFGTDGFSKDISFSNIQRCSLEKPLLPARRIVASEYGRILVKNMIGGSARKQ